MKAELVLEEFGRGLHEDALAGLLFEEELMVGVGEGANDAASDAALGEERVEEAREGPLGDLLEVQEVAGVARLLRDHLDELADVVLDLVVDVLGLAVGDLPRGKLHQFED